MDHPTSNNLPSWFTKCMCPMCLGATCGERSIRLLGENDTFSRSSPLSLCSSLLPPILDAFLVLTLVVMDSNIPKEHQHTTHNTHAACFMPRHSKVGFKVLYSIISNLSRNSGCLIPWLMADGEWRVFQLSFVFFFGKRDETKSGNSLRYTTKQHVSPYHVDPIPSVYVWNPKHIYIIQNVFSWFVFVKKRHGIAKALCVLMCSSSTTPRLLQHVPMIHEQILLKNNNIRNTNRWEVVYNIPALWGWPTKTPQFPVASLVICCPLFTAEKRRILICIQKSAPCLR